MVGVTSIATSRSIAFANAHRDRSPLLVIDPDVIAQRFGELVEAMPDIAIFYAVKANPAPEILRLLVSLGASFDVASIGEIDACLEAGATPDSLSFGNTIKKRADIECAYARGVRRFAFDSDGELDKLIDAAPGATVFCRVLCDGFGAAWPLSRKFGCSPDFAADLLRRAATAGLAVGASFHVGSQQFDVNAWDRALAVVADLRAELLADEIHMQLVNLGGGLPGSYVESAPGIDHYGDAINQAVQRRLGPGLPPEILIEPGRYLVADAGTIRCEVVTVGRKSVLDDHRWVFLDVGVFTGLVEVLDEAIHYRFHSEHDYNEPSGPVVLAGPTCDSADVLYERTDYSLPLSLAPGDALYIDSCGAYTATYSTVGFNGFVPLDVEILPLSHPVTTMLPQPAPSRADPSAYGVETGHSLAVTPADRAGAHVLADDLPGPTSPLTRQLVDVGRRRRYPAGTVLMAEGDPGGAVHVIVNGRANVVVGDTCRSAGKVVGTRGPGDLVGELSALDGLPRSATVVAATDIDVCTVSASALIDTLLALGPTEAAIVRSAAKSVRASTDADAIAVGGAPVGVVAEWLLAHGSDQLLIQYAAREVAGELLVSQETLSRALSHLAALGALVVDHGRVVVLDSEVLQRLAT